MELRRPSALHEGLSGPHMICSVTSVMSDSLWPYTLLPTRVLCPWDSPGKNTGVGCHFLLQGSPGLRDQICISCVSCIAGEFFTHWDTWEMNFLEKSSFSYIESSFYRKKKTPGRFWSLQEVWSLQELSSILDKIFVEGSPGGNTAFLLYFVGKGRWCRRKDGKPGLVWGFITCEYPALLPLACLFTASSFQCLHFA